MALTPRRLRTLLRVWPTYRAAGVKVREFSDDGSRAVITYKVGRRTKNAVGTAFGGTLFSMTDPFCMLLSMSRLGSGYTIWDTHGEISFLKAGRGTVTAIVEISDSTYKTIIQETADGKKYHHWFDIDVKDETGDVVAHVRREVYYRKKRPKEAVSSA